MNSPHKTLVICGPTASGKSGLALSLARELNGVIINADSLQIYQGLPLLTAQPSAQDLEAAPHKLYATLSPDDTCNAQRWRELALLEMTAAVAQGKMPIIAGGTGLYIRALVSGFSPIPEIELNAREQASTLLERIGHAAFHQKLTEIDRTSAEKIPAGNTQRMIRAYEVYLGTGKPLSHWHEQKPVPIPGWSFFIVTLLPRRETLYQNCNLRLDQMITAGALEEVRSFETEYPHHVNSKLALGYSDLSNYLNGTTKTLTTATDAAKQHTRNYAKRQVTWFKHQIQSDLVLEQPDTKAVIAACQSFRSCV